MLYMYTYIVYPSLWLQIQHFFNVLYKKQILFSTDTKNQVVEIKI